MTESDAVTTDPVVARVGDLSTTVLDVLAVIGLAVGATLALWQAIGPGLSVVVGSVIVGLLSAAAQRRATPRARRGVGPAPLPGPEHPGTLHVAGR